MNLNPCYSKSSQDINQEQVDKNAEKIAQLLKRYNLSVFHDEIKTWDDPKLIVKKIEFELQKNVSFFLNDNFLEKNEYFAYQNIKVTPGYKLDFKNNKITINFTYKKSKVVSFNFNVWKTTQKELIDQISQKIAQKSNATEYYEKNWKSFALIQQVGQKYLLKIIKQLGTKIEVNKETILLNQYRFSLNSWKVNHDIVIKNLELSYRYIDFNKIIVYKVQLKPRPKMLNIISWLSKQGYLDINISTKLNWKDSQNILNLAQQFKSKFQSIWVLMSKIFYFENSAWNLHIVNHSPIGPFDQTVTVFWRLDNNNQLIPVKLKYKVSEPVNDLLSLQTFLQKRFDNIFFKSQVVTKLNGSQLLDLVRKIINNQAIVNGQKVPFPNSLKLVQKSSNNDNLTVQFQIEDFKTVVSLKLLFI